MDTQSISGSHMSYKLTTMLITPAVADAKLDQPALRAEEAFVYLHRIEIPSAILLLVLLSSARWYVIHGAVTHYVNKRRTRERCDERLRPDEP